jgi:hypothetical protein
MEPLTAARLLALSCWLLAFPAGLRAFEKGVFLEKRSRRVVLRQNRRGLQRFCCLD